MGSGATGVGLVAPLFDPADVAAKNWDSIRAKVTGHTGACKHAHSRTRMCTHV